MADEWLFPLLQFLNGKGVTANYILIIGKSANKALAKSIIESPGAPINMEVNFCLAKEFQSRQGISIQPKVDVFINLTSFVSPAWLASQSGFGVLQLDFNRNHLKSIYAPMRKNYLPTVVHVLLLQPDGKEYIIETMQYRTIDYSLTRQLAFVRQASFLHLSQLVFEVPKQLFRIKRSIARDTPKRDFNLLTYPVYLHAAHRYLLKFFRNLFEHSKWNIGVVKISIDDFLEEPGDLEVSWLPEDKGLNFAADPFAFRDKNDLHIVYEKLEFETGKGKIESVKFNGTFSRPVPQIEREFHLSYPYLVEENGNVYMIPESSRASSIDLLKLESDGWRKIKTLVNNFEGVDPTICKWNDKWWMFCTSRKEKGADLRLYIYYSDHLEGNWMPHQLNPVKTSICSARPAGTPFIRNGVLFRPAQDSSRSYGSRIVIHEVITLSETDFDEREVACIQPWQLKGPYHSGVHTVSGCGEYTLIDGKRTMYSMTNLFRIFRRK